MSFGVAFALPARIQTLNAGASPFGQLGPTLDLVFAGIPTDPLNTLVGTLDLFFTRPLYEIAEAYSVWEIPVGMVAKTFSQIITFTRASSATYFDAAGVLQTATTNVPRFDYNPVTLEPLGFLIEESRTNSLRNNTMQGAAAGSPGTAPTNWSMTTTGGVITRTIVGTGTENGVTYIDAQYQFSGAGTANIVLESLTQIAAASGQSWTASSYVKLVAGSYTNVTTNIDVNEYNSGGSFLAGSSASYTATTSGLTSQRPALTRALNQATTAFVAVNLRIVATGAADITLRIGLPQLEQGAFATSVIPTTTVAVARNADVASVNTLSPWYNAAAGTLYFEGVSFDATSGNFPRAVQFNDGTLNNVIQISRNNSTGNARMSVITGGVSQAAADSAAWSLNTAVKSAIAYAANDFAISTNGAVPVTDSSGTVPTVSALFLGSATGSTAFMNGWLRRVTYYPRVLTAAELRTLTLPAGATLSTQDYSLDTDFTGNTVSVGA